MFPFILILSLIGILLFLKTKYSSKQKYKGSFTLPQSYKVYEEFLEAREKASIEYNDKRIINTYDIILNNNARDKKHN